VTRGAAAESERMRAFRAVMEEGHRAWNEGDFERAYGALPEDFEYQLGSIWPQARALRGPDEIVAFFHEAREMFPDLRSTPPRSFRWASRRSSSGST